MKRELQAAKGRYLGTYGMGIGWRRRSIDVRDRVVCLTATALHVTYLRYLEHGHGETPN